MPQLYLHTKGETEKDIQNRIMRLAIFRPSLLLGNRNESRFGERFAQGLYPIFNGCCRAILKIPGIHASEVAKAMVMWLYMVMNRRLFSRIKFQKC